MKKVLLLISIAMLCLCCNRTDEWVPVMEVKVTPAQLTLAPGESVVLSVEILPSNASDKKVSWKSSNIKVAEVRDNGEVKAIASGTATITVTAQDGNKTSECKVTVFSADSEVNGVKFEFVNIPQGTFLMGSPQQEPERNDDESPQHEVTLSGFYMSKYEVTQAQWKAVMGADNNPSYFKGDKLPVEMVGYDDVLEFIDKLNELTNKEYRLPTEAEWEYACRAGTNTPFFTGNNITTNQANYKGTLPYNGNEQGEYRGKTTDVGIFAPNAWGLYDMHGNVWEWCSDKYGPYPNTPQTNPTGSTGGNTLVIRGGSWDNGATYCRSALRISTPLFMSDNFLGFRLVHPKK